MGGLTSAVGGNEQRQGQKQSGVGLHEAGHAPSDTGVVVYVPRQRALTNAHCT